jgi:hypothetical protein
MVTNLMEPVRLWTTTHEQVVCELLTYPVSVVAHALLQLSTKFVRLKHTFKSNLIIDVYILSFVVQVVFGWWVYGRGQVGILRLL